MVGACSAREAALCASGCHLALQLAVSTWMHLHCVAHKATLLRPHVAAVQVCSTASPEMPHTQRGLPSSGWAPSGQELQGPCCSAGPPLCVPVPASCCITRLSAAWEVSVQTHQHWT